MAVWRSGEEWRGWKYVFADFLHTKSTGTYLFLEDIVKSRDEPVGDSFSSSLALRPE